MTPLEPILGAFGDHWARTPLGRQHQFDCYLAVVRDWLFGAARQVTSGVSTTVI